MTEENKWTRILCSHAVLCTISIAYTNTHVTYNIGRNKCVSKKSITVKTLHLIYESVCPTSKDPAPHRYFREGIYIYAYIVR